MKDQFVILSVGIAAVGIMLSSNPAAAQNPAAETAKAPAAEEPAGIASNPEAIKNFGWMVAKQTAGAMKFTPEELALFIEGFQEGAVGDEDMESKKEALTAMDEYLQARNMQIQALAAKEASKETDKFFIELAKDPEIKKTESGLHYKIVKEGKGAKAVPTGTVTVHYEGTLIDGTKFDSSFDRGEPATFGVSGVVPGFSEGVQLTGVGGEVMIYMPSNLGYGENPRPGGVIKPGDALIFRVQMVGIK
ncbi:MAG: FKBP-type peptidyl-prolyl cis-trans isomerase [Verrucomicrobiales bacterium]|jgi:FKBP-type peptidyl-prolyl cis-trans isomerase